MVCRIYDSNFTVNKVNSNTAIKFIAITRTLEHMVRIRETFHQFPVYSDKDTSEREDRFSGVFCRYLGDYKLTMIIKQVIMSEA